MIEILRCGCHSRHSTPFEMNRRKGLPVYLLLLVKTNAYFYIAGRYYETGPGMALLLDKKTPIRYGCKTAAYNDDWIHFDVSEGDELLKMLSIPYNEPIYVPDIHVLSGYASALVQEHYMDSRHTKKSQDAWMRLLLYHLDEQQELYSQKVGRNRHYLEFNSLRTEVLNAPYLEWTVEKMANRVHMSESYFQHQYRLIFGRSCIQDVIGARIEYAKYHLATTEMPIHALAGYCGYVNELHFMRQFKNREGITPSQYRTLHTL